MKYLKLSVLGVGVAALGTLLSSPSALPPTLYTLSELSNDLPKTALRLVLRFGLNSERTDTDRRVGVGPNLDLDGLLVANLLKSGFGFVTVGPLLNYNDTLLELQSQNKFDYKAKTIQWNNPEPGLGVKFAKANCLYLTPEARGRVFADISVDRKLLRLMPDKCLLEMYNTALEATQFSSVLVFNFTGQIGKYINIGSSLKQLDSIVNKLKQNSGAKVLLRVQPQHVERIVRECPSLDGLALQVVDPGEAHLQKLVARAKSKFGVVLVGGNVDTRRALSAGADLVESQGVWFEGVQAVLPL